MILFNSIILKRNLFLLTINNGRIFNQIFSPIFQILIKLIDNYSNRYKRIIIAQAIRIAKYLRIPKCRISKAESGKQIPTSSLANTRHLYSQTPTWTPRFSLMRDMDTNWGGEGRGRERIVEKQEMPRKVSLQIIVLSSSRYSTLSLSLWKSFFFFFTTTTTTTAILSQIRATFLSPRKNPFSGARYVRRRGSSGALPPPSALHPSSLFSALYPLRDS